MATLDVCIKHLANSLKKWSSLYDKDSFDKATSTLAYLRELKAIKEVNK